jgi:hypothetical protein
MLSRHNRSWHVARRAVTRLRPEIRNRQPRTIVRLVRRNRLRNEGFRRMRLHGILPRPINDNIPFYKCDRRQDVGILPRLDEQFRYGRAAYNSFNKFERLHNWDDGTMGGGHDKYCSEWFDMGSKHKNVMLSPISSQERGGKVRISTPGSIILPRSSESSHDSTIERTCEPDREIHRILHVDECDSTAFSRVKG